MFLYTILVLAVSVLVVNSESASVEERIIGGSKAKLKDYPYYVRFAQVKSLWFLKSKKVEDICAGSLINANSILTSSMCLLTHLLGKIVNDTSFIAVGNEEKTIDISGHRYEIDELHFVAENLMSNGLAIVKTKTPISFNHKAKPIALPESDEKLKVGDEGSIAAIGYGNMSTVERIFRGEDEKDPLKVMKVKVVDSEKFLQKNSSKKLDFINPESLYIVESDKSRACTSEEGSGMVASHNGKQKLYGVLTLMSGGCSSSFMEVTSVTYYLPWIKSCMRGFCDGQRYGTHFSTKF